MNQQKEFHTFAQSLIFRGKVSLLQLKRAAQNTFDKRIKRFASAENLLDKPIIATLKTPLWTESAPEEQFLLAGKVHNLRLAVKRLNGVEIAADEIFSFWTQVGRASRANGYAEGRELREGCIIPSIGGGLCQLSNALYDAALKADFEIVERHAHTQIIPGSLAEKGRDATVFWNYVDLRFKSSAPFRIEARLGKDHLHIKFKSEIQKKNGFIQISKSAIDLNLKSKIQNPKSCTTCGVESCFRSLKADANLGFGRAAFLVDEFSPEFDEYIQNTKRAKDSLFLPIDGKRFRKPNYAWTNKGFAESRQSFRVTFERSYKSRKLAAQGAARQMNLLSMDEKLAASYAERLKYDQTHLVIQQNLLPFLWQAGVLGGRTFDVLMTALPLKILQERLDFAHALHPSSATLGDFRACKRLIEAETEALENAEKIVTAHTAIASLFDEKAARLEWKIPPAKEFTKKQNEKFTVVFPASTVGRKGCYELREALRDLNIKLIVLGAELEEANFWRGIDCEKGSDDWLAKADLVALPAFVEHKPRRLLQAVANKIPVVASKICGVENINGILNIEADNVEMLRDEIKKLKEVYKSA